MIYTHLGMNLLQQREEAMPARTQWALGYFRMLDDYLNRSLNRRKTPEKYNIPKM